MSQRDAPRRRAPLWALALAAARAAPPADVCFNGCSGHGTCKDFMCSCAPGWHGDDCGFALTTGGDDVPPVLGAGHFNVTAKNFSRLAKIDLAFVAFSSRSCHSCVAAEAA